MYKKIFLLALFAILNTSCFTPESNKFNTSQAANTYSSFAKPSNPEPIIHGLPQSQFEALKKAHPNFTANILRAMNMPKWAFEATINVGYDRIKKSFAQLTEEQAHLFGQLKNKHGKTLIELAEQVEVLKELYHEVLAHFDTPQSQPA